MFTRQITRLAVGLALIASFVFALVVGAVPDVKASPTANTAKEKTTKQTVSVTTDAANVAKDETEKIVKLYGESTYALSTCPPQFTATLGEGIDRQRPLTQPPAIS